jgi:hypothetical protein
VAKPQPIQVPADACVVTIDGTAYTPHEGESVWVIPGLSIGAINALTVLTQTGVAMDAAKGEADEGQRVTALMDRSLQGLSRALAQRIVRWDWTDMLGNPLPQPNGTPEPLMALEAEELYWLLSAVKGETPAQAKND